MEKGEVLIRMTKSVTKNMGNYESARIEYGMEKVVDLKDKAIELQKMSVEIDDFLNEELEGLMGVN